MYFNFVNLYYLEKGMLCLFTWNIYTPTYTFNFICYLYSLYVTVCIMIIILSEVCEKMLPTYFQIFIFSITWPIS